MFSFIVYINLISSQEYSNKRLTFTGQANFDETSKYSKAPPVAKEACVSICLLQKFLKKF